MAVDPDSAGSGTEEALEHDEPSFPSPPVSHPEARGAGAAGHAWHRKHREKCVEFLEMVAPGKAAEADAIMASYDTAETMFAGLTRDYGEGPRDSSGSIIASATALDAVFMAHARSKSIRLLSQTGTPAAKLEMQLLVSRFAEEAPWHPVLAAKQFQLGYPHEPVRKLTKQFQPSTQHPSYPQNTSKLVLGVAAAGKLAGPAVAAKEDCGEDPCAETDQPAGPVDMMIKMPGTVSLGAPPHHITVNPATTTMAKLKEIVAKTAGIHHSPDRSSAPPPCLPGDYNCQCGLAKDIVSYVPGDAKVSLEDVVCLDCTATPLCGDPLGKLAFKTDAPCGYCHAAITECCLMCSNAEELQQEQCDVSFNENCGHGFHSHCIAKWLLKSSTCPTCSEPFRFQSFKAMDQEGEINPPWDQPVGGIHSVATPPETGLTVVLDGGVRIKCAVEDIFPEDMSGAQLREAIAAASRSVDLSVSLEDWASTLKMANLRHKGNPVPMGSTLGELGIKAGDVLSLCGKTTHERTITIKVLLPKGAAAASKSFLVSSQAPIKKLKTLLTTFTGAPNHEMRLDLGRLELAMESWTMDDYNLDDGSEVAMTKLDVGPLLKVDLFMPCSQILTTPQTDLLPLGQWGVAGPDGFWTERFNSPEECCYAVVRQTTSNDALPAIGNSADQGRQATFGNGLSWAVPGHEQTPAGMSCFLSCLYALSGHLSQSPSMGGETLADIRDSVIGFIELITGFPPAAAAFSALIQGGSIGENQKAALSQSLYTMMRSMVPPEVKDSQVFEQSAPCFSFIVRQASAHDSAGYAKVGKDVSVVDLESELYSPEPGTAAEQDQACVAQLLLSLPGAEAAPFWRRSPLEDIPERNPDVLLVDWRAACLAVSETPYLQLINPLQLPKAKIGCLTMDERGHVVVFSGRGKDTTRSSILWRPIECDEKGVDHQQLALKLKSKNLGHMGACYAPEREPEEAIVVCLDISSSMSGRAGFIDEEPEAESDEEEKEAALWSGDGDDIEDEEEHGASLCDVIESLASHPQLATLRAVARKANSEGVSPGASRRVVKVLRELFRDAPPDQRRCIGTLNEPAPELLSILMEPPSEDTEPSDGVPSNYLCPVTMSIMMDPVLAVDGFTYERAAIEKWFETHATSPMTGAQLSNQSVTPNHALRSAILEWQEGVDDSAATEERLEIEVRLRIGLGGGGLRTETMLVKPGWSLNRLQRALAEQLGTQKISFSLAKLLEDRPLECAGGHGGYQIFVVPERGGTMAVEVKATMLVAEVKELLDAKEMMHAAHFTLLYGGKPLDEGKTMEEYGIVKESTLFVNSRRPSQKENALLTDIRKGKWSRVARLFGQEGPMSVLPLRDTTLKLSECSIGADSVLLAHGRTDEPAARAVPFPVSLEVNIGGGYHRDISFVLDANESCDGLYYKVWRALGVDHPPRSFTLWRGLSDSGDGQQSGFIVPESTASLKTLHNLVTNEQGVMEFEVRSKHRKKEESGKFLSRMDTVKQLFHAFVNRSEAYAYPMTLALVLFGSEVKVAMSFSQELEEFKEVLDDVVPGGDTRVWDALEMARVELDNFTTEWPKCAKRIIVLSDGTDTKSEIKAYKVASKLQRSNIIVDSIQIGTESNDQLHSLAKSSGGLSFAPRLLKDALKLNELETILCVHERPDSTSSRPPVTSSSNLRSFESEKRDVCTDDDVPARKSNCDAGARVRNLSQSLELAEPSTETIKRILREMSRLMKHARDASAFEVFPHSDDVTWWRVVMEGPDATPYRNSTFVLYAHFPVDYPRSPPEIRFLTPILHCNVSPYGRVCHSILDRNWTADTTMLTVLQCVYGLMLHPDTSDPLDSTLALQSYDDSGTYEARVMEHCSQHSSVSREALRVRLTAESDQELIKASDAAKARGALLIKAGELQKAVAEFKDAIDMLHGIANKAHSVPARLNRCLVSLQLGMLDQVEEDSTFVVGALGANPFGFGSDQARLQCSKAYFRRATGRLAKPWINAEGRLAILRDLKDAAKLQPADFAIRSKLEEVRQEVKKSNEARKASLQHVAPLYSNYSTYVHIW